MRFAFEGFEVDLEAGQLFVAGRPVTLERRAFEMLCYLAAHPNRLVSKEELLSEVWQARALSDGVVMNAAAKLRKALGQAPGASGPIETVRGRGYRLQAVPRAVPPLSAAATAARDLRTDPFVGREAVLQTLEQVLDQALQGQGQLVLLSGEPGIGKTRTLNELAERALARGFSVWEGAAYDGGAAPAYWPWIEILRAAHVDLSRAMFRHHLASDSWALALLVPELIEPKADDARGSVAEATRFRLFDELARFLGSASVAQPRLIIADDVHWADAGSIELFVYAARALKKRGVLFALALREHAIDAQDARAELLARLGRQATHVTLSGLAPAEVQQLVAALAPRHLAERALGAGLHERTQGNPFFVRQLLEHLSHAPAKAVANSATRADTAEQLTLPKAVRDLLQQRVAALDVATLAVLRMAAALGMQLDLGVLASALDQSHSALLALLAPALQRGVLAQDTALAHRFSFQHVLLREAIYDEIELAARGQLHARLAQVLEQRAQGADLRALGEIAHHHLLAVPSQIDACVRYCERAAAAARAALGYEAAAELLELACAKLASEGGHDRARCRLLFELGQDRFCVGDVRKAWQALWQAAAVAQQLGAADLFAEVACRLASWIELGGGDEDEVRTVVDRALSMNGDSDPDLRAALLAHQAELHFELPVDERYRLLDEADALAADKSSPLIILEIALCRACLRDPTRPEAAERALSQYRAVTRRYGRVLPAPRRLLRDFAAELGEYVRALTVCELDAADGAIERCRGIAEQSQVAAVALGVDLMLAARALGDGRLADLTACVQRLQEGSSLPGGFSLVWASYAMRLLEAQNALNHWAGFSADTPPGFDDLRPTQQMNGRLWLARLNLKLGAHDKARALLASIPGDQLERMPVRYGDLGLMCYLAEIYEELADTRAAAALYTRLLPYAERNAVGPAFEYDGAVAHYLGVLAAVLGQTQQADRHFAQAELINRKLRMPLHVARSTAHRTKLHAS